MIAHAPPCDRCDTMMRNDKAAPELSERQQRFLDAYRQRLVIAPAARLARVHRATVYRWRQDAAFAAALRRAADEFFPEHRAEVLAAEEARQRWRRERELERRPMRCRNLALAREAKRRKREGPGFLT
jgi:hypothetical protein